MSSVATAQRGFTLAVRCIITINGAIMYRKRIVHERKGFLMATLSSDLVLVTGATGFIGLNTVLRLLEEGFSVRATVRNDTACQKVIHSLRDRVDVDRLGFAIADLTKNEGWRDAARGCLYVVHTAHLIRHPTRRMRMS